MHDRVQLGARRVVAEDDRGQRGAVERPSAATTPGPNARDDGVESGRAGLDDLARDRVGVDAPRAPRSASSAATVLLPDPTPPVSPTRMR